MASRAQEQFLSSLRHTLLDLARRLQHDTVSEDVDDYALFRLEQISRHLVRLLIMAGGPSPYVDRQ